MKTHGLGIIGLCLTKLKKGKLIIQPPPPQHSKPLMSVVGHAFHRCCKYRMVLVLSVISSRTVCVCFRVVLSLCSDGGWEGSLSSTLGPRSNLYCHVHVSMRGICSSYFDLVQPHCQSSLSFKKHVLLLTTLKGKKQAHVHACWITECCANHRNGSHYTLSLW